MNQPTTPHDRHTPAPGPEPLTAPMIATAAVLTGGGLLTVALIVSGRVSRWAGEYGAFLVYLALALYLGAAGWLLGWGTRTLYQQFAPTHHRLRSGSRR